MMARKKIKLPPAPGRTASALRGLGYEFGPAVCDLVDNSIAANATVVSVKIAFDSDNSPSVTVIDNGDGMNEEGLINAMKIGSDERDDPNSLGKFGFGLKTASTAFCRELEVTTKQKGRQKDLISATYDIDEIVKKDDWEIDIGDAKRAQEDEFLDQQENLGLLAEEKTSHGTLISWKKVDRLLLTRKGTEYSSLSAGLNTKIDEAKEQVGKVFHRFLNTKDNRADNIKIFINEDPVQFWDPFCEDFSKEIKPKIKKTLDVLELESGNSHEAKLRGFILPLDKELEGWEKGVHDISLKNQGIYAYRENRLVDGPDWFGIGVKETHINQLRVELSFNAQSDEAFGIGVTKDKLVFPPEVFAAIDNIVAPLKREADEITRNTEKGKRKPSNKTVKTSDVVIGNTLKQLDKPTLIEDGDAVSMSNNTDDTVKVTDDKGKPELSITVREVTEGVHVFEAQSLEDGVLWQPGVSNGEHQAHLNIEHEWYRKCYYPSLTESKTTDAIHYLLYSLAVAELNNTDLFLNDSFEQFRVEVSRNLKKLVKHLPDPD